MVIKKRSYRQCGGKGWGIEDDEQTQNRLIGDLMEIPTLEVRLNPKNVYQGLWWLGGKGGRGRG